MLSVSYFYLNKLTTHLHIALCGEAGTVWPHIGIG